MKHTLNISIMALYTTKTHHTGGGSASHVNSENTITVQ